MAQGHRVLITGVSRFLGLRLAKALSERDDVEAIFGVDLDEPPISVPGLEFMRADIRSPMIARVLSATRADVLVHTNISSSPGRLGGRAQMKENNVIGTMQLLAAAQRSESLKKLVMRSSTAIYGSRPGEPSIIAEDYARRDVQLGGYAKDCAEAEQYSRNFARRRPDVKVVILRMQNVIGPTVSTNMTGYFKLPLMPTALGFDPRIQLLHEADATSALVDAVTKDVRGIFNIAGDGVVYLSQAIRLMDRAPLPLVLPFAQASAQLLRRAGLIDFPPDQLSIILFGRVVDTRRAKEKLGFRPRYSTRAAISDFKKSAVESVSEPSSRSTWERELIDYVKKRAENEREHA